MAECGTQGITKSVGRIGVSIELWARREMDRCCLAGAQMPPSRRLALGRQPHRRGRLQGRRETVHRAWRTGLQFQLKLADRFGFASGLDRPDINRNLDHTAFGELCCTDRTPDVGHEHRFERTSDLGDQTSEAGNITETGEIRRSASDVPFPLVAVAGEAYVAVMGLGGLDEAGSDRSDAQREAGGGERGFGRVKIGGNQMQRGGRQRRQSIACLENGAVLRRQLHFEFDLMPASGRTLRGQRPSPFRSQGDRGVHASVFSPLTSSNSASTTCSSDLPGDAPSAAFAAPAWLCCTASPILAATFPSCSVALTSLP